MPFTFPAPLYPIVTDNGEEHRSCLELARAILAAGVRFLQLRVKNQPTGTVVEIARAVKSVADASRAQLIINDRPDVAKLIDAAGVHLGQHDLPAAAARQMLGSAKIIGVSTHNLRQAEAAGRDAIVDYVGFGPIFPTTNKKRPDPVQGLEGLRLVRPHVRLPIVAIGGITAETMPQVLAAGADAVAMIGEIRRTPDVTATVRALLRVRPG
jgi:thiamine-phosphate pyrophosphorylase